MRRYPWNPLLAVLWLAPALLACPLQRKSTSRPAPQAEDPELTKRVARLELRVIERDAQIEELQRQLDEARREVVRAMAKLQTLATRAEAASGIAEAELALQGLRRRVGSEGPETGEVGNLITMSTGEFDRQNFGGALYLANQAKSLAAAQRGRMAAEREDLRAGEAPFAVPLRLRTLSVSNVRSGPGMGFGVVLTLPKGVAVLGLSAAGEWIRISDEAGRSGWVFISLVGRR